MLESDNVRERTETFSRITQLESALYDAQGKVKLLMEEREQRSKRELEEARC